MAEAIVVGAGVFGAALADRLVTEGWVVRLIDRFGAGDPRAESGGCLLYTSPSPRDS